jgi:hypothetical protein
MVGVLREPFFVELTSRNVWITFERKFCERKSGCSEQTGADVAGLS